MKELFIKVPNAFLVEGEEKLSSEELYLYYYLALNELRWFENKIVTSVNVISNQIQLEKNSNNNKKRIKERLVSLAKKKVINIDVKDFTNNTTLTITKQKDSHYMNRKEKYKNGYEEIYYSVFNSVNESKVSDRANEFMILCYILKNNRSISFDEWSRILDCNVKTVKNLIPKMEQKKMINVFHGRYYINDKGQYQQEMNQYNVNDKQESEHQPIEDVKEETVSDGQEPPEHEEMEVDHHWHEGNLDEDDFILYWSTDNEELKKKAEAKIKRIKSNDKGKWVIEQLESAAKQKLADIEYKQKERERKTIETNTIEQVEESNYTIIERNDEYLELTNADDLKMDDYFVFVREDNYSMPMITQKELYTRQVKDIIAPSFNEQYMRLEDSTKEKLLAKIKDVIREKGKFDHEHVISNYRDEILMENNKGKDIDSDWEGDMWEFDGQNEDGTSKEKNKTRIERVIRKRNEEKHKQEQLRRESNPVIEIWKDNDMDEEEEMFA